MSACKGAPWCTFRHACEKCGERGHRSGECRGKGAGERVFTSTSGGGVGQILPVSYGPRLLRSVDATC